MHDRTIVPVGDMADADRFIRQERGERFVCRAMWVDVSVAFWQGCCRAGGWRKRESTAGVVRTGGFPVRS